MKISKLVTAALLTAVVCVLAPITVPMGVIPLSAATLGVYLAAGMQNLRYSTLSVTVYVLIGALGAPVFAGYAGGMAQLTGVTGGFLIGYVAGKDGRYHWLLWREHWSCTSLAQGGICGRQTAPSPPPLPCVSSPSLCGTASRSPLPPASSAY